METDHAMEEIEDLTTENPVDTIETNPPVAPPSPPRRNSTRTKTRGIEELLTASPKDMSQKEMSKLIAYQQDEIAKLSMTKKALEDNIKSAYAAKNEIEKQYQSMLQQAESRVRFIKQATQIFSKTIIDLS